MIYIIHKNSVLLKVTRITLKIIFSNAFFLLINFFSQHIMLKISRLKLTFEDVKSLFRLKKEIDETIIKGVKYLFRLKKEKHDTTVKDIRNYVRLKKEKTIKNVIIRDIRILFEHKNSYYKPVRVLKF